MATTLQLSNVFWRYCGRVHCQAWLRYARTSPVSSWDIDFLHERFCRMDKGGFYVSKNPFSGPNNRHNIQSFVWGKTWANWCSNL